MAIRKRNEFLDGDESEEEIDRGYDSDAAEESRGRIGGGSKRRKVQDEDQDSGSDEGEEGEDFHSAQGSDSGSEEGKEETASKPLTAPDLDHAPSKTTRKPSAAQDSIATTPKQFAAAAKAARKSGVLYISRVPPFMKPQTLRHYLTPHASEGIGRIFLTPEDSTAHTKRVRAGGNKKKTFTDGWVEFTSKTEAKQCAEMLNGNIIGGKKGSFYHDDLWNVKYLHGFKWADLTEQISAENAARQARLREEVRKTRQENKAFVRDVERGKMMEGMERKKAGRGGELAEEGERARKMEFKQREVKGRREGGGAAAPKQDENVSRVLGKIF